MLSDNFGRLPSLKFFLAECPFFSDDEIGFISGGKINDIECRGIEKSFSRGVFAHIVSITKRFHKSHELFFICFDNYINIIDFSSGYKSDIIVRKKRAFSREEFKRRKPVEILGGHFYIVSAEDSILSKLEWAQKGESERQFNDAVGVAEVQWGNLNIDYLKKWAKELDLVALLDRLITEVQKLQT